MGCNFFRELIIRNLAPQWFYKYWKSKKVKIKFMENLAGIKVFIEIIVKILWLQPLERTVGSSSQDF